MVAGHEEGTPTVVLFCGLPGSGKTTLARQLEAAGRGVRICTDDQQAELGVGHADTDFHERLQVRLYGHALALLRHGVDVILEDGLWLREERRQKFSDARAAGARIEWHVLDVPFDTLWARLQRRNESGSAGAHPMTVDSLRWAWSLFEPPSDEELAAVEHYVRHAHTDARPQQVSNLRPGDEKTLDGGERPRQSNLRPRDAKTLDG